MDIISIAQHANPKVIGHTEFLRTQLIAASERRQHDSLWLLRSPAHLAKLLLVLR